MTVSIGPRIGVEGVKQFRQAFLQITAEAKKFDTEMKRITASFDSNDSAMERNRKIREQLTKQIEHQKTVVRVASDTYEEAVKAEMNAAENYEDAQKKAIKTIAQLDQQKKDLKRTIADETQAMNVSEAKVADLTKKYNDQKAIVDTLTQKYGENDRMTKNATATLDSLGKELDEETKKYNEHKDAVDNAKKAIQEADAGQSKAKATVQDASNTLYRASTRVQKYGTDLENAKVKQGELNQAMNETKGRLEILNGYFKDFGGVLEGVGDTMTKYITAPLTALGTYGVKNATSLTDGMAKIYTIATETQEPMEEMKQGLIDLSDASGFALDDLTEAAYQSVSASVDAGKAVEFLGDATKLARAGFTSTTKSVDLLTTIINSYNYEVEDAAQISDVLLKTQNDGKTIIDELADSMGVVVPTASAYHVSLEQLAAAYATMTKQGVSTSRATTFINALFSELEKEGKGVSKVLKDQTGKSFAQLMDSGWSLGQVLQVLYEHADKDSEEFANLFKNIRSGRAANALMADEFGILNDEIERMGKASGQTDYALQMLETPSLKARRALNKLKNSTVDLGDTLISALYPIFEKLVEYVDAFRDWVKNLTDTEKKNITTTLALAAAFGPVLKGSGLLIKGVGNVVDLYTKLGKATKGATSVGKALTAVLDAEGLGFAGLAQGIGIAVGAYAALGAVAKISYDQYREGIVATDGLREAEKQLIESSTQLHDSTMQMNAASKQEADAINTNTIKAERLVERYNWLMDNTSMTAETKKKLADTILNDLAEALGMEIDDVKKLIDENGKLSASIEEVIQKKRLEALMAAYEDDYGEALKNRTEAEKKVIQLTTQKQYTYARLTQTQKDLAYWEKRANEEAKTANGISEETQRHLDEAVIAHSAANAAYEETAQSLREADESYQTIMNTIESFEGATAAIASGSAAEIEASLIKMTEGFITAERGTKQSLENQVKNAKHNLDKIQKAFDEGADGVTQEMVDGYKKLYEDSEIELDKWTELNNKASKGAVEGFVDDITKYREPIKNATKNTLNGVTQETDSAMKKTLNTADTGFKDLLQVVKNQVGPFKTDSAKVMEAMVAVFKDTQYYAQMFNAGSYFMQGFVNGLKAVNVTKTSNKIMTDTVQASKQTLHEQSPSKVMFQVGQYFTEGFANGIAAENRLAQQAASNMAQSAVDSSWMLNNYTPTGVGYSALGNTTNTRNITAPISVSVNVNGNVDNVDELAEVIADRINSQIIRQNEVFA